MDTSAAPSGRVRPTLGAERSRRRDVAHGLVLLVPWGGLVWAWWRLLRADGASGLGLAGWVVGICVLATSIATLAWVAHNLRIARQRGPRRGLPTVALEYSHDWTGRPVRANWAQARAARVVVVATDDGTKSFLPDPTEDHWWADEGWAGETYGDGAGPPDRIEVAP